MLMRLNTTFCVYCQAANNCMVNSRVNTDDNDTVIMSATEVIKADEDIAINGQDVEEDEGEEEDDCDYVDDEDEGRRMYLYSGDSEAAGSRLAERAVPQGVVTSR